LDASEVPVCELSYVITVGGDDAGLFCVNEDMLVSQSTGFLTGTYYLLQCQNGSYKCSLLFWGKLQILP
jgi:hypothetical protein